MDIDLTNLEKQEQTFIDENGMEVTMSVEPIIPDSFDLTKFEKQEHTYINENGEKVTQSIEPVRDNNNKKEYWVLNGYWDWSSKATSAIAQLEAYFQTYNTSSSRAKITRVFNTDGRAWGGSFSGLKPSLTNERGQYGGTYTAWGNLYSSSMWVRVDVIHNDGIRFSNRLY